MDDGWLTARSTTDAGRGVGAISVRRVRLRRRPRDALGWELKPEGLCRGGVCVPVRDRGGPGRAPTASTSPRWRALLDRPLALDVDERVAYLGASAAERGAQLATLQAPDFTLPDLDGRPHSLADYRGRKVLLVAYASW